MCMHYHMVIRDLKFHVPSLVKWTMAPSCLSTWFLLLFFFFLISFVQSALVTVKSARLDEIVGAMREEKEEEPEGEVVGDDSTGN